MHCWALRFVSSTMMDNTSSVTKREKYPYGVRLWGTALQFVVGGVGKLFNVEPSAGCFHCGTEVLGGSPVSSGGHTRITIMR